jgi:type I restriction enzyme S subunit
MNAARLLEHFDRVAEAPGAVPRLRRFILDLAVRGKLVEQDVADRVDSPSDFPFHIPTGWKVIPLGTLVNKLGAGSTPLGGKSIYRDDGVLFLRSQNIHDSGIRLDGGVARIPRAVHERMSGTHVRPRDLLLNITGASIGRCAIVPDIFEEANVSQHVAIVRLNDPELRHFVHLQLTSPIFQQRIHNVQVGVSREGLSMRRLRQFPMLIPPVGEQQRIVAKVDELMSLCDWLEAARAERERRRDRVVAASVHRVQLPATSSQHHNANGRDIEGLPERLTRRKDVEPLRRALLNLAVTGRAYVSSRELVDSHAGSVSGEFKLPADWIWARLSMVCRSITDGDHLPPPKASTGVPFLVIGNLRQGRLVFEGCRHVPYEYYADLDPTRRPQRGDLLYTLVGSFGIPVIVDRDQQFCVQRHIGILRPSQNVDVRFLARLMASAFVVNQASRLATGIAQKTVPLRGVRALAVPLPPLAEQRHIVEKLNELMAVCDRLEAQLAVGEAVSSRLLDALLHEALGHQSAPASVQVQ